MATGKCGLLAVLLIYEIFNGILNNRVQDFSLFHDDYVYCDGSVFFSDDFHSCICFGEHLIDNYHLSLTSDWKCQGRH